MAAKLKTVSVRVPASTSNLGSGFDCLGLALGLYNELTITQCLEPGPVVVEIQGEGADYLPKDASNLTVRAAALLLGNLNETLQRRLIFRCVNHVPLARGLGSSSTAIVAGLVAANRLRAKPVSVERLLALAISLEGHPDNVAPALYGGMIASLDNMGRWLTCPLTPHKDLTIVVCIPNFQLETERARAVLPQTVSLQDAVFNASRALVLGAALEHGAWAQLGPAMEDRLHQPYRAQFIPGFANILAAARTAGAAGAALSGSGPTILALCAGRSKASNVGRAMIRAFARQRIKSRSLLLPVARIGAFAS